MRWGREAHPRRNLERSNDLQIRPTATRPRIQIPSETLHWNVQGCRDPHPVDRVRDDHALGVVTKFALEAGLNRCSIDVSALTDTIYGYVMAGR